MLVSLSVTPISNEGSENHAIDIMDAADEDQQLVVALDAACTSLQAALKAQTAR